MDLNQFCRILDELEPGMSIVVPRDWVGFNIEGADQTDRDMKTIELVLDHGCTWEQNPEAQILTFAKQPPGSQTDK
jgi:hypothetical protein